MLNVFSKKKENENLSISNILIAIFLIIAIFYTSISLIRSSLEKKVIYTKENINQYMNEENLIKSDYFYVLDSQISNFLTGIDKDMYSELYGIYIDQYKKFRSKSEITKILKKYKDEVFKYSENEEKNHFGHLVNAYQLPDSIYLVQLDFDNEKFYMLLQTRKNKYNFAIIE